MSMHFAFYSYWFALQVVNTVTSNQECVSNIAESLVLSNLLLLLHSLPSSKKTLLNRKQFTGLQFVLFAAFFILITVLYVSVD